MGRQIRFYMMDDCSGRLLIDAFIQNGLELILSKRIQNETGMASTVFESARIDDSVLAQTQYLRGVCRFRKPEYGTFESYVSSPCIEWTHRQTKLYADRLPVSRLYINTQCSDRWEPGALELLLKDYKALTKVVNKLAPLSSVEVNGVLIRARMDKVAVEYVKKGYHLGI